MRKSFLLHLVVVGRLRDKLFAARCDEFVKRLGSYGKCTVTILPDSDVAHEGAAICRELDRHKGAAVFVLSEEGKEWTTEEFAGVLGRLEGQAVFVIGGPFGLAPEVKARATVLWSLAKLTFTHEIARLLLCEQLYRALNFLNGGSYHHE